MITVPNDQIPQFLKQLETRGVPAASFAECIKWVRYFLDYCDKYPVPDSKSERVRLFVEKLKAKKQTDLQCRQAAYAVSVYFESQREKPLEKIAAEGENVVQEQQSYAESFTVPQSVVKHRISQYSVAGFEEKSDSLEWDEVIAKLADEIKFRHYSRKTLKTYAHWSRQFQRFLKNKPPTELSPADIKEYLTYLAVKCKVAASTQNQAFNALLFLYRHALKIDFGRHDDIPRAKKSLYIPMVLSMAEIEAIVKELYSPYNLFVKSAVRLRSSFV